MTPSNYQKTSETEVKRRLTNEPFEIYLKHKGHAKSGITNRLQVLTVYRRWLAREQLEVEEVSYNDVLAFMKNCQKQGNSQRTIQHYLGTIKHYYDYLLNEGKIGTNPVSPIQVKGIKRKTLYQILEPHELSKLYHKYRSDTVSQQRNKVMIGLMVYQGLKTEELGKLEVKAVDLRAGTIQIPGGKRSNERNLQLESHQMMEFYEYLLKGRAAIASQKSKSRKAPDETTHLFISDGGNYLRMSSMISHLMSQLKQIDPRIINARQIRASVITKWLKGYNLREVQYLAGHKYVSSTEQYLQNEMEGLKEEVQQFHPLG